MLVELTWWNCQGCRVQPVSSTLMGGMLDWTDLGIEVLSSHFWIRDVHLTYGDLPRTRREIFEYVENGEWGVFFPLKFGVEDEEYILWPRPLPERDIYMCVCNKGGEYFPMRNSWPFLVGNLVGMKEWNKGLGQGWEVASSTPPLWHLYLGCELLTSGLMLWAWALLEITDYYKRPIFSSPFGKVDIAATFYICFTIILFYRGTLLCNWVARYVDFLIFIFTVVILFMGWAVFFTSQLIRNSFLDGKVDGWFIHTFCGWKYWKTSSSQCFCSFLHFYMAIFTISFFFILVEGDRWIDFS